MAWTFFRGFKKATLDGTATAPNMPVDWDSDNIGIALVTTSYTPGNSHFDLADLSLASNEVSGTNYARKQITSIAVNYVSTTNARVTTTMTDPSYAQDASGFNNAKHAIMYKTAQSIGSETEASSPVIAYNTFASSQGNVSGTLTLEFSSDILLTLS